MKKPALFLLIALFLGFYSCGEQRSKALQTLQKDIENVETQIQETNDCDELQLLTFAVLGLRTDLEKLQQDENVKESEVIEMTNAIDQLDASLTGKYVALDCNQAGSEEGEIDVFGEGEYEEENTL